MDDIDDVLGREVRKAMDSTDMALGKQPMVKKTFSELKQMYREGEFAIRHGLVYLEPRHVVEHKLEQEELVLSKQRIADLERQLAKNTETFERLRNQLQLKVYRLERHNELLREIVKEAEFSITNGLCPICGVNKAAGHFSDCLYKAAIDGGALGGNASTWQESTERLLDERWDLWQQMADESGGALGEGE